MYTLLKQQGRARRGQFQTVHGTVQTPAFMNVGTSAAIKGGISSYDLKDLKCQVELCNTYQCAIQVGVHAVVLQSNARESTAYIFLQSEKVWLPLDN